LDGGALCFLVVFRIATGALADLMRYPRPVLASLRASLAPLLLLLPLLLLSSCSTRAAEGKPEGDGGAGKPTACGQPRPVFGG
jgi:hypothetical protein